MNTEWLRAGLAGLVAFGAVWAGAGEVAAAADQRPNIVLIMTDDEDVGIHAGMPKTRALIEEQGVVFDNYFVTYAFCCPSRATILRGQYAHNHRIQGNILPAGGARKFRTLGHDRSTIATWLKDSGYYTAFIGKYLNDYNAGESYVPPGWDEWYAIPWGYFNYTMNENGRTVHYGDRPEDYSTDVIARHVTGAIQRASAGDAPFFFFVAPYAPHSTETAAPRHEHLFPDVTNPRSPSFDEADVSDKPELLRDLPPLDAERIARFDELYRKRLLTLQAVDELVETIVTRLEAAGELDNTYIVYTSDNGWHMGEHRMSTGKTTPYEEDIRVPFAIRGPGVPRGLRLDPFVLNNDLAPTFAALAGVQTPSWVDGRSFLPLFEDPEQPWRQSFALQRRQRETGEMGGSAHYDALRTADWTYVEYANGERELYDLQGDPYQLNNVVATAEPQLLGRLSKRLAELANCAGANCREIEDQPITPVIASSAAPAAATAKQ